MGNVAGGHGPASVAHMSPRSSLESRPAPFALGPFGAHPFIEVSGQVVNAIAALAPGHAAACDALVQAKQLGPAHSIAPSVDQLEFGINPAVVDVAHLFAALVSVGKGQQLRAFTGGRPFALETKALASLAAKLGRVVGAHHHRGMGTRLVRKFVAVDAESLPSPSMRTALRPLELLTDAKIVRSVAVAFETAAPRALMPQVGAMHGINELHIGRANSGFDRRRRLTARWLRNGLGP